MREFSTTVNNALANGLQPNESFRDTSFFKELLNLVPYRSSLRPYEPVVDVLQLSHQKNIYPFPQWFRMKDDNIIVTKNDVSEVDDSYQPFDIKHLQKHEWELGEFTEPFRMVDYGGNWMLLNRDGAIYKLDGEISSSTKLQAGAFTMHKNRTLIGGALNGLWTPAWKDFFRNMFNDLDLANAWMEIGTNVVFWSSFDSLDFPFGFIDSSRVLNELDISLFNEQLYGNQFGFMEMPFTGSVLDIHSLSGQVIVFGEDGIAAMAMQPESPGAGFVLVGQQSFGIKSRGAAGGDEESLVFIDAENNLWYMNNQGIQKLDYRKYMKRLTGQIYIRKDPDQEQFYIGDEQVSYTLNHLKLSQVNQTVISIDGGYDYKAGTTVTTEGEHALIETESLDIGIGDLKTLTGIHLNTDQPFSAKAQASSEVRGKRVTGKEVMLNHEGYAATRLFGKNHGIKVIFENFHEVIIDGIELKWQTDDNRQRRGFFATQDASGAG